MLGLERYKSVVLLLYSTSSGAQGSHADLLPLYSVITFALHNNIILIITHLLYFNP